VRDSNTRHSVAEITVATRNVSLPSRSGLCLLSISYQFAREARGANFERFGRDTVVVAIWPSGGTITMPTVRYRHIFLLGAVVVSTFALAVACNGDDDDDDASPTATQSGDGDGGDATSVNVTLQEWSVSPDVASASAGPIEFTIENTGPENEHEFVVLRTDLDPGALPTGDDGTVDESGEGIEVVDEVEEIAVGDTGTLTLDLAAGNYVLICNLVDEETEEAHYGLGMRTAFTVN
jgi:hypothetical protein